MNRTDAFLGSIRDITNKPLEPCVIKRVKHAILDYLGVTFAGTKFNQMKLLDWFDEVSGGTTPVVGIPRTTNMEDAVFINGLNAHAIDFDDGTNAGIIHLGSPLFSVLLPLAQTKKISIERFLGAIVMGYEASYTMAVSIQPKHKALGFHATGTCGMLGISLAVAYALQYTEEETKNSFSAAAVSANGTLKVLEDGSELKPYNVAKASLMGYISARIGKAGFQGPNDVLAGERGFLNMMSGNSKTIIANPLIDGKYAIEKAYIKPYAACRYCHPAIDAAIILREMHNISARQVEKINVRTYHLAVNKHDHVSIQGSGSAKMSIPYSVAVALCLGKAGYLEYENECIKNKEILELTRKVSVIDDKKMTAAFPHKTSALVEVTLANGKVLSQSIDYPKGEPENPMSEKEIVEKFISLALYSGKSLTYAERIIELVFDVENQYNKLLEEI